MNDPLDHKRKSRIEALEEKLYEPDQSLTGPRHRPLEEKAIGAISQNWEVDDPVHLYDEAIHASEAANRWPKVMKIALIGSGVFFAVALIIAGFTFFQGGNSISTEELVINVSGPVSVSGGEPVLFEVAIQNDNAVPLQTAELSVVYPEGTRSVDEDHKELKREQFSLGVIPGGKAAHASIRAIFFGEEGTEKEILLTFEYRVKGSNAIFYKDKKYSIKITSAPVDMTIDTLDEVTVGREFPVKITVRSNATEVVKNLVLKADYGFGFQFVRSDPKAFSGKDTWKIGDLRPGEKRTVEVVGSFQGQEGELRTFRFSVGPASKDDGRIIGVPLLALSHNLTIKKPFLGGDLLLNGEDGDLVVEPEAVIVGSLNITNNLAVRITDVEALIQFSGPAFNKNNVSPGSGLFSGTDSTLRFEKRGTPDLALINPGDNINLPFDFSLIPIADLISAGLHNPEVAVKVTLKAKRFSESRVPEDVVSIVSRKIRLATKVDLLAQLFYAEGPLKNSGPMPPKADTETTYTVVWTISNTLNTLSRAQVVAMLPAYVGFVSEVSPATEKVDFNANTGEVTWQAGEIKAEGVASPRQVAFKIVLRPSLPQVGEIPNLVSGATLSATDRFTSTRRSASAEGLSTRTFDGGFNLNQAVVVAQ